MLATFGATAERSCNVHADRSQEASFVNLFHVEKAFQYGRPQASMESTSWIIDQYTIKIYVYV